MEEGWSFVQFGEASVRIDCSNKTVTFRLSLQPQNRCRKTEELRIRVK